MKDFITDEEMIKLESQGIAKTPDFISDFDMESFSQKPSSLGQRFKASFGGPEAKSRIIEGSNFIDKGGNMKPYRGFKEFAGDIADVAGGSLPLVGGILGSTGGAIGTMGVGAIAGGAIGATAGESVRQAIGRGMGVREDVSLAREAGGLALTGALAYVGGKTGQYIVSRFPKIIGMVAGEDSDIIRYALKNPKAADLGIENGDDALRIIVQKGSEQSIKLKSSFIEGYNESFNKIIKNNPGKLVSRQKMLYGFVDDLAKQKVRIKDGVLDFTTSKIIANPGEIGKINNAYNALVQWDDWTLAGTNKFKQLIGGLTRFADDAGIPSKSPFLGKYYHFVDNSIKNALPKDVSAKYSVINKVFSDHIDTFDDIVDAFNKGDPFTKLAQSLGQNKDSLRRLLEFYDKHTGGGTLATIAGRKIAEERVATFGILNPREWIDIFLSPKLQGKIITRIGKMSNPVIGTSRQAYDAYKSSVGRNIEIPMNTAISRILKFGK